MSRLVRTKRWACPACGRARTAPYCAQCGEEKLRPHDLTSRDLASQLFHGATDIDGRLLRSFRLLLTRPGALTVAHVRGERRAYLGPLQLFLIANALFFAVQSLTHTNIFSSPLASHLHDQDWSALAGRLVTERLRHLDVALSAYAPRFDRAVTWNAKALIILMVIAFTPCVAVLFYERQRPIGAHLVFALHLYVFILLLFVVALAVAETNLLAGGAGLRSPRVDMALSVFNLAACGIYLFFAIGAVHGCGRLARAGLALLLTMICGALVLGYRFAIFLITLYTT